MRNFFTKTRLLGFVCILVGVSEMAFFSGAPEIAHAASAGPNYTSIQADTSSFPGDDTPWSNLSNMGANDGSAATNFVDWNNFDFTTFADTTGYGFSIPAGATINGVLVEVSRKTSSVSDAVKDMPGAVNPDSITLLSGGSSIGTSKASSTLYTTSYVVANYGSSSDLWGATLTPTIINSSTFGFRFAAEVLNLPNPTISVDFIRITVYYTGGASSAVDVQSNIITFD